MKIAKLIYKFDIWVRHFSCKKEKALSLDEDHKQYIRAKRNKNHLPDSWTDTRWISKIKSWKNRSKVKHQYEPHVQSEYELNYFFNNLKLKQDFLFKLKTLYNKDGIGWYFFTDKENLKTFNPSEKDYYDIAIELCEEGLAIGDIIINSWTFIDFGTEKQYTQKILSKCRINPDIIKNV